MFDWRGDTKAGAPTADVKSPAAVQSVDWITNRVLFRSGSGTDASTSVSFFSAAIGTPGTRIHPLDHVYTVLELMRPPSPLISINVSAKMPPIGKPRLSDALASKYTSNRSSPVRHFDWDDIPRRDHRGEDGRRNRGIRLGLGQSHRSRRQEDGEPRGGVVNERGNAP